MIDSLKNVHILAPAGEQRVTVTDFDLGCAKQQKLIMLLWTAADSFTLHRNNGLICQRAERF